MLYPISEPIPDSVKDRFGYIDDRGNVVVPPVYSGCSHFFEGKAAVIDENEKTGFIDAKGRLAIPHRFEGLGRFHSGVCFTCCGYINHFGEWLIPPAFLAASAFSEGLATASTDAENFGFIDFTGRFVLPPHFRPCKPFHEGLAAVCIDERWGFINRAGELEIPTVFEGPPPKHFRDGIAGVRIDGRWGFIDRSGSFVIKPEHEDVKPFSEGRACVRRNGKWGMMDPDGHLVLECQFEELEGLDAGMAPAKIDGKAGFISPTGKWLIESRFDRCLNFFRDLAVVKHGKTYSYIRRDGQIVWTSQPGAQLRYPPHPFFV